MNLKLIRKTRNKRKTILRNTLRQIKRLTHMTITNKNPLDKAYNL